MKKALRDARKKVKKGELVDGHDLSLYLRTISARYAHLNADIDNSTRVYDYSKLRGHKIAETRELLDFFSHDHSELERLSQIVAKKAERAERIDDFKHQKLSNIDLSKLRNSFNELEDGDK